MTARLTSLLITFATVAGGGALAAVGAYATSHQAEQPALYVAIALATRELNKWLDKHDWTRGSGRAAASVKP